MTVLRSLWHAWKRFGEFLGNLVGRVVLTVFYFTILAPFGIGVRLLADPLQIKAAVGPAWRERHTTDRELADARRLA